MLGDINFMNYYFFLSSKLEKNPKLTMNWSFWHVLTVYPKPNISYSPVPQSSIVAQKTITAHQWVTLLHRATCPFINMNSHRLWCTLTQSHIHLLQTDHNKYTNHSLKIKKHGASLFCKTLDGKTHYLLQYATFFTGL